MKKALAFILLSVYFFVSTGFVVCFHYCMDKIDSVEIGVNDDEECGKCGMEAGNNACCFDDVKVVKLDDSHLAAQALALSVSLPQAVASTTGFLLAPFEDFDTGAHQFKVFSPPPEQEKLYIRNRVFRI